MIDPLIQARFHTADERVRSGGKAGASNAAMRFKIRLRNSSGGVMICSLRSVFLLPVVVAVGASFCLAQTGSITRIEENDASITYSGIWGRHVNTSLSGGSAMTSNDQGARAVVSFTGTGISWIGLADEWSGPADVTIDGRLSTVNTSSEVTRYQVMLFTVSGLANGPHKLSIEVRDERGFGNHT